MGIARTADSQTENPVSTRKKPKQMPQQTRNKMMTDGNEYNGLPVG